MKITENIVLESFGLYDKWSSREEHLPQILEYTTNIPISEDSEFGMIFHFSKHKNDKIEFTIDHPHWLEDGKILPPFTGTEFIKTNDFRFFIGDHFWAPFADKAGKWTITVYLNGKKLLTKSFNAFYETDK